MQAIQLFHYKSLLEYLHKLQQEEIFNLPCEHETVIIQHQEKLKEIYTNYQVALEDVSVIIRQFEEHKQSIRRLISLHKHCRKHVKRKEDRRVA